MRVFGAMVETEFPGFVSMTTQSDALRVVPTHDNSRIGTVGSPARCSTPSGNAPQ